MKDIKINSKILLLSAKELREGKSFIILTKDKQDLREAQICYNLTSKNFCIWFNGKIIWSGKSFAGIGPRLEKLNNKFPLDI